MPRVLAYGMGRASEVRRQLWGQCKSTRSKRSRPCTSRIILVRSRWLLLGSWMPSNSTLVCTYSEARPTVQITYGCLGGVKMSRPCRLRSSWKARSLSTLAELVTWEQWVKNSCLLPCDFVIQSNMLNNLLYNFVLFRFFQSFSGSILFLFSLICSS